LDGDIAALVESGPTFTFFPKLPIELRLKVWYESFEKSRRVEIKFALKIDDNTPQTVKDVYRARSVATNILVVRPSLLLGFRSIANAEQKLSSITRSFLVILSLLHQSISTLLLISST
jgi:hypothetical protein